MKRTVSNSAPMRRLVHVYADNEMPVAKAESNNQDSDSEEDFAPKVPAPKDHACANAETSEDDYVPVTNAPPASNETAPQEEATSKDSGEDSENEESDDDSEDDSEDDSDDSEDDSDEPEEKELEIAPEDNQYERFLKTKFNASIMREKKLRERLAAIIKKNDELQTMVDTNPMTAASNQLFGEEAKVAFNNFLKKMLCPQSDDRRPDFGIIAHYAVIDMNENMPTQREMFEVLSSVGMHRTMPSLKLQIISFATKHLMPRNSGHMEGPHRMNDLAMQGHAALQTVIPSKNEFEEYLENTHMKNELPRSAFGSLSY